MSVGPRLIAQKVIVRAGYVPVERGIMRSSEKDIACGLARVRWDYGG